MFTGIVEATAQVSANGKGKLTLERPTMFDDVKIGSSVCVSGACLSIVELEKESMAFDVVSETLARTTLGSLKEGDCVNLERALAADGRFDGHIVQGHVESVALVDALTPLPPLPSSFAPSELRMDRRGEGGERGALLMVEIPSELLPFVVAKGSIALDGVSLTVAALEGNRCTVALIPHTLASTTLGALGEGSRVNVETDILARYARRSLPQP